MKEIIGFIKEYYYEVNKPVFLLASLYVALLIYLNYATGLEQRLLHNSFLPYPAVSGHFLIYFAAYLIPFLLVVSAQEGGVKPGRNQIIFLVAAPAIFAMKAGMPVWLPISSDPSWNHYWNTILSWPLRLVILLMLLLICRSLLLKGNELFGFSSAGIKFRPYLAMVLIMIPLIGIASGQPDFLTSYPKMKQIIPLPEDAEPNWVYFLLFQLSYGCDFISVEVFFRGFLVIGLSRWLGTKAILPMACFYCSIHFGKPLGECISSYFGGLLLGIVSYHTRSIYGGLIVHLGIAWMMELGGSLGNRFFAD